jgi:putative transposase
MPNHVHLVVVPASEESLGLVIGKVHGHFTQYANRTRGTSGHLWENRFYSCPMDETHVLCALRYVDRNPVRAGLFEHARDYEWSSALAHVSGRDEFGLIRMARWEELLGSSGIDWSRYVEKVDEEREIKELKAHTARGIFLSRGQAPGFAAAE